MVFELKKLSEDEKIKQQMEARADYESRIATARGAGRREGREEAEAELQPKIDMLSSELQRLSLEFEEYKENHK